MPSFGEWFAARRSARGFFSQDALADGAGVSRSTVQSIERDEGFAHRQVSVRVKLAAALGFSVWDLEEVERGCKRKNYEPPAISPNGVPKSLTTEERLKRLEDLARNNGKMPLADAMRLSTMSGDQVDARNLGAAASGSASAQRSADRKKKRKRGGDRP